MDRPTEIDTKHYFASMLVKIFFLLPIYVCTSYYECRFPHRNAIMKSELYCLWFTILHTETHCIFGRNNQGTLLTDRTDS